MKSIDLPVGLKSGYYDQPVKKPCRIGFLQECCIPDSMIKIGCIKAPRELFYQNYIPYLERMNPRQQIDIKIELKEKCRVVIQERMDALRMAMNIAQDAANEETKSSAGDKYETSRAMGHLEKDMYARQLTETGKEMASLMSIDCPVTTETVQPGNLVLCGDISYFILAGIGKITFDGKLIFVISPNAPVAKSLLGKKKGDKVSINNSIHQIKEIL